MSTNTRPGPQLTTNTGPDGYTATIRAAAEAATVFAALTSADAISQWWAPCSGDATAGGELSFRFGEALVRIDVVTATADRMVTWAVTLSEPLPEWEGTSIVFDLAAGENGETVIDFCHEGLIQSCECFDMCRAGWEQYLPSLVDYLEHAGRRAFGSENDTRAKHLEQTRARD